MYDAPKARIEEVLIYPDSARRGFAVGWAALVSGFALAVGWTVLLFNLPIAGSQLFFAGLGKLGWLFAFGPVFWLGVHHHRRGHRETARGMTLALGSLALLIVLLVGWMVAAS